MKVEMVHKIGKNLELGREGNKRLDGVVNTWLDARRLLLIGMGVIFWGREVGGI